MDAPVRTGKLPVLARQQARKDLYQANTDQPKRRLTRRPFKTAMAVEPDGTTSSREPTGCPLAPRLKSVRQPELGKHAGQAQTQALPQPKSQAEAQASGRTNLPVSAASTAHADSPDVQRRALPGGRRQAARQAKLERREREARIADAAVRSDGDARAALSESYRKGTQGVKRSKREKRYWAERAALNGKAPLSSKAPLWNLSARRFTGSAGTFTGAVAGAVLGAVGCALLAFSIVAWPVMLGAIAAGTVAASVAGVLWARARYKAQKQAHAAAYDDHLKALARDKPANSNPKESLIGIGSADDKIPANALGRMLDDLYKVPENRVILDTAARLAETGHIAKIHLRDPEGQQSGGVWDSGARHVEVNYGDDEDWSRGSLMHELTHAVASVVYDNQVKTYRTAAQKRQLKQAIDASVRRRPDRNSQLEVLAEHRLNEPYTEAALYEHKRGWKTERMVRIPELLAYDYAMRAVVEKNYAEEWAYFHQFRADCADFLKRAGGSVTATEAGTPAPPTNVIKGISRSRMLALSILDEAVTRAFGNTLGRGHMEKLKREFEHLVAVLDAYPQLDNLSDQKRAQLRDGLASFYAGRMSRSLIGNRRQYGFADLNEDKLKAKVSDLVQALA